MTIRTFSQLMISLAMLTGVVACGGPTGSNGGTPQAPFYLSSNGVTVMCPEAAVGDSGVVGGVTYTKLERGEITPENAATTCTSGITDMSGMFGNASAFNEPIGGWDTSNVTNMSGMFHEAAAFNQPIGSWVTSNVTDMSFMFNNATAFNRDLSSWCVVNVIFTNAFSLAASLWTELQPIWETCPPRP